MAIIHVVINLDGLLLGMQASVWILVRVIHVFHLVCT